MNVLAFMLHPIVLVLAGLAISGVLVARAENAPQTAPAKDTQVETQALEEVDRELSAFEQRMNAESSPVNKAAMKTRFVVLKQRRAELEKRFTAERHAALMSDLRAEVNVTAKSAPAVDPNEGKARRTIKLEDVPPSAVEKHQAEALAAKQRDEQFRAERAAEQASQRQLELARIDTDLSRLAAQIDSATVGNAQRRAELNMKLRELEAEKRRLELSPHSTDVERLRTEIDREIERVRR